MPRRSEVFLVSDACRSPCETLEVLRADVYVPHEVGLALSTTVLLILVPVLESCPLHLPSVLDTSQSTDAGCGCPRKFSMMDAFLPISIDATQTRDMLHPSKRI
jgi:hypothetical protein